MLLEQAIPLYRSYCNELAVVFNYAVKPHWELLGMPPNSKYLRNHDAVQGKVNNKIYTPSLYRILLSHLSYISRFLTKSKGSLIQSTLT